MTTSTKTSKTTSKTTSAKTSKTATKKPATTTATRRKRKILFVASEAAPFIATGGLAEVVGSLSKALSKSRKYDARVVLPLYEDIKAEYRSKFKFVTSITTPLSWRNQYCGVFEYKYQGVTFYFIDNEYYFKRHGCYGYFDDGERFAFFCASALEILPHIGFSPDILHCHDWQAALAALYLKTNYCHRAEYQHIKALFTIHNIEYQGWYDMGVLQDLFGISYQHAHLVEYNGGINLMKGAIECCERFSTVSPTYAEEIKYPYFAHGLDPIIRRNEFKLTGILNGIDPDYYNPSTDKALFANYSTEDMQGKAVCKAQLQKHLNLPVKPNTPVVAMITRLVAHKGIDLVTTVIEELLEQDVQFVVLGTGEGYYEGYFKYLAERYPDKVAAAITFNADLSRKIYSGADMFLMPSKSEPCGLAQMIASRYGTIAIVRETGGLVDSITPYGAGGNGFTFRNYNAHDMLYVINEAIALYRNKEQWSKLVYKAATTDFTWSASAKRYDHLYSDMLKYI